MLGALLEEDETLGMDDDSERPIGRGGTPPTPAPMPGGGPSGGGPVGGPSSWPSGPNMGAPNGIGGMSNNPGFFEESSLDVGGPPPNGGGPETEGGGPLGGMPGIPNLMGPGPRGPAAPSTGMAPRMGGRGGPDGGGPPRGLNESTLGMNPLGEGSKEEDGGLTESNGFKMLFKLAEKVGGGGMAPLGLSSRREGPRGPKGGGGPRRVTPPRLTGGSPGNGPP